MDYSTCMHGICRAENISLIEVNFCISGQSTHVLYTQKVSQKIFTKPSSEVDRGTNMVNIAISSMIQEKNSRRKFLPMREGGKTFFSCQKVPVIQ